MARRRTLTVRRRGVRASMRRLQLVCPSSVAVRASSARCSVPCRATVWSGVALPVLHWLSSRHDRGMTRLGRCTLHGAVTGGGLVCPRCAETRTCLTANDGTESTSDCDKSTLTGAAELVCTPAITVPADGKSDGTCERRCSNGAHVVSRCPTGEPSRPVACCLCCAFARYDIPAVAVSCGGTLSHA